MPDRLLKGKGIYFNFLIDFGLRVGPDCRFIGRFLLPFGRIRNALRRWGARLSSNEMVDEKIFIKWMMAELMKYGFYWYKLIKDGTVAKSQKNIIRLQHHKEERGRIISVAAQVDLKRVLAAELRIQHGGWSQWIDGIAEEAGENQEHAHSRPHRNEKEGLELRVFIPHQNVSPHRISF